VEQVITTATANKKKAKAKKKISNKSEGVEEGIINESRNSDLSEN